MTQYITEILLWLFVINLGIAFGAGLYEARIIVPQWVSSPSTYRWPDTGPKFWAFVTTVPLTLLTIANLVAVWQAQGAMRAWWLGAVAAVVVERIMTFMYFIPTGLKLQRRDETISESKLKAMTSQWAHLNYVRLAIDLAAWVAALKAFSMQS
ncbi:protein of unknown function (DUF1772) [Candidatus Methanoperedens nitroreducens]|uniref:DUF1772 domain-containing protein n=1 Tax=Candidatus Methanoperedens nitratireducens TaxID=1392998 RepID=A0A062V1Z6_9EURY|nr:anthrone oxygenase family protein [Candidatus Methanoperedens nitroreducens]KCZ71377.1 protein of unknown function (DUF1772) [Candidatus Methanoperedens nitroreducens]MDJ1421004.1 DUF1772 domain-containing protein [Candidatus Methanoperedens sp.]